MKKFKKRHSPGTDQGNPKTSKGRSKTCRSAGGTQVRFPHHKQMAVAVETMLNGFAILGAVRDEGGRFVDFRFEYINEAGCRMIGLSREEILRRSFLDLFPAAKEGGWFEKYVRTVETGEPVIEDASGYTGVFAGREIESRVFDARGVKMGDGLAVSWMDVTERVRMDEDLRRRAEELETLLHSVPAVVWIAHDPDCLHITGNRAADEFLRLPRGAESSLTAPESKRPAHFKVLKDGRVLVGDELPVQRAARGEVISDFEISHAFDDGTHRHLYGNAKPLYNAQGQPRGSVAAFVDITERKRAEEGLKGLLAEKDILLQELSHRTKNNMQVIAGLLDLQAGDLKDEKITNALSVTKDRIRVMALVHEHLYRSGNVSSLNMREYIIGLLASLLRAYSGTGVSVSQVLDLEEIFFSIDMAVPCGLIINELVSNSLKHAFPDRKGGTIFLSMRRMGEETILKYRDDGSGLPRDLDLPRIKSLGLKLVYNLAVRQLRGKLDLQYDPVPEFIFLFPDLDLVKRV